MGSPFAAMWLMPFLGACAVSIYGYGGHRKLGAIWWGALAYLLALIFSAFVIRPIPGSAATFWIMAIPSLCVIFIKKDHIKECIFATVAILTVYALGLIVQQIMAVSYSAVNYEGRAWPLINPNNAALVINFGLIGSLWMAIKHKWAWVLTVIFTLALLITHSRAGMALGFGACSIIAYSRLSIYFSDRDKLKMLGIASPFVFMISAMAHEEIITALESLATRLPIWEASTRLITTWGAGLGSFNYYYQFVRTETHTAGQFAHNDLLQILIEGGVISLIGISLLIAFCFMRKGNLLTSLLLLVTLVHSMIEFQLYVPAISMLVGLTLVYHRLISIDNLPRKDRIVYV